MKNKNKKKNKNLFKNKNFWLIICSIVLLYFIGGIVYVNLDRDSGNVKNNKNLDKGISIKGFDYILYEDDIDIYKDEFKKLKKNLESSNVNYTEYAESISKMFVMDLYSLEAKKNMYDVGGVQFVYPDIRDNYKLNVTNTLYKYMKDNSDGKREQDLPMVKSVSIKNEDETKYKIGEEEFDGYKINLDIEYVKDLEYDKSAEIILVKKDKYLYIVEKN